MTLAEKRKVIEVLLCTGSSQHQLVSIVAVRLFGWAIVLPATTEHAKVSFQSWSYEDEANEAAYRLIETSPTLRREWFSR